MLDLIDDLEGLAVPEQEAYRLAQAAMFLDQARTAEHRDTEMVAALEHNLELWVTIRTLNERAKSDLSPDLRENLVKLGNFVAQTTFSEGVNIGDDSLDTLIAINLHLAEGLGSYGRAAAQSRRRA